METVTLYVILTLLGAYGVGAVIDMLQKDEE